MIRVFLADQHMSNILTMKYPFQVRVKYGAIIQSVG